MVYEVKENDSKYNTLMTDHALYSLIYILITWFVTLVQSGQVSRMSNQALLRRANYKKGVLVLMAFLIILMGLRPALVGGDTGAYMGKYRKMMNGLYDPEESVSDWLFSSFQYTCSQMMPVSMFFLLVSFLYVYAVYVACKRFALNNATFLMLCAIGAFSFFTYGVNGIRNGLATSFIVLAIAYIKGNRVEKLWCALFCFIAINIHKSTALPMAAMLFSYFYKKPRFMFYIWGAAVIGSILMGERLSGLFMLIGLDGRMEQYLTLEDTEETEAAIANAGFRWDFLLYSAMPIFLGWYCIFKKKLCDLTYQLLLGTYIYANAVWVILIRLPFSNRFAYLSWFLYGIVLAYPLFKFNLWRNQGQKVQWIMMAHVTFTFFMWFYTGL